ncbi:MAG: SRPBCC domain-containing protein [Saprospiraceae bacterium]|nr:SRPBCC domain-containing protein [Saprospiraceae bacterium]
MKAYDWTCFSKRLFIKATANQLFYLFYDPGRMESWFLRKCEFTREGKLMDSRSKCRKVISIFLWHGWSDETFEAGRWLETEPNVKLGFTFNGNNATRMEVHITIDAHEEGSLLTLTQNCIPDDENSRSHWHLGCMEGWIFYLTNLKSIAEGGLDLRNKNANVQVFLMHRNVVFNKIVIILYQTK